MGAETVGGAQVIRVLLGAFIVAHGLLTALIWASSPKADAPFRATHSWLLGDARPLAAGRHHQQRRDPLRRIPSPTAGLAPRPPPRRHPMTRYRIDIEAARRRLAAREHHSIQTPYGAVQYAERGQGSPLLFSHPLVGGYDVGLGCAESWIGDGFRVIASSRFGYLGSSLPPGAMPADQADAYALLLDALGIERAAVAGFSAGGPSVIQFALRHPDRTSGLILFGSALPGKAGGPPKPVAQLLFTDLVFWA